MNDLDWNWLKAFLHTAQSGSLSAAARKLGLTQPTLSRQVAAIERQMGVTLFERVGKSMVPTPTGLDLLEHARAMGNAAEALGLAANGRSQAVGGVVTVSASDAVAAHLLPVIVRRLRAQEPGIAIEVISSNAVSDLLLDPSQDRGLFQPAMLDRLLSNPQGQLTPLNGSKLWQLATLNMWLSEQGI